MLRNLRGTMDYDKLVEGRRRNWEALKPEEIRQKEREEAREKRKKELEEGAKSGKKSTAFERMRRIRQDAAAEEDRERFQKVLRQSGFLVGGFVALIIVVVAAQRIMSIRQYEKYLADTRQYETVLMEGESINDLTTPVGALATWRSVWKEGDMRGLLEMYSPAYLERLTRSKTFNRLVAEYDRLNQKGSLNSISDVALNFDNPELVRVPPKPWTGGELAIFRSDLLQRVGEEEPTRYIVAFSWDPDSGQWRFAELREAKYFSVKWERESLIQSKRRGNLAAEYDDEGNEIERPEREQ
jgi:hypothetical protein